MTDKPLDDLDAVRTITEALKNFKQEEQERILRWAIEKIGLRSSIVPTSTTGIVVTSSSATPAAPKTDASTSTTSADRAVDIKTFIEEKQPRSDVQFAASVAYYFRFEAPPNKQKESIDKENLLDACRKANWTRLKNPYQTLMNAHTMGLLDKGSEKATFVLNTVGENLVAMTLPSEGKDPVKPRRSRKVEKAKKNASRKAPAKKASAKTASKTARKV